MEMINFRLTLEKGVPQFGLGIMYPSPGVVERIGPDWDWVWIDGQHGQIGYAETLQLVRACDLIGRPAVVRVPGHEAGPIGLTLDMGVAGVVVPCVDTAEQAQAAVEAAKFPPLGKRSYGGRRPIDFFGRSYSDSANEQTLLLVQIETPQALANIEEIASVRGVDALFIGLDDLYLRRGLAMDKPRPLELVEEDMKLVIEACRRHNLFAAAVGIGPDMLRLCLETGYHLIVAGGDVPFLVNSSKNAAAEARAQLHQSWRGIGSRNSGSAGEGS